MMYEDMVHQQQTCARHTSIREKSIAGKVKDTKAIYITP